MRRTLRGAGLVVAAASFIATGTGGLPVAEAADVCITVRVTYNLVVVSNEVTPGTQCIPTPFVVTTLSDSVGVNPYLTVEYDIDHP